MSKQCVRSAPGAGGSFQNYTSNSYTRKSNWIKLTYNIYYLQLSKRVVYCTAIKVCTFSAVIGGNYLMVSDPRRLTTTGQAVSGMCNVVINA